jgi:hypothetical protein
VRMRMKVPPCCVACLFCMNRQNFVQPWVVVKNEPCYINWLELLVRLWMSSIVQRYSAHMFPYVCSNVAILPSCSTYILLWSMVGRYRKTNIYNGTLILRLLE